MKHIDLTIVLLTCCFAVILLIALYMIFAERVSFNIKKAAAAIQAKGGKGIKINRIIQVDYDIYHMSVKDMVLSTLQAGTVIFAAGYIFYRSVILSMLLMPLALLYPRLRTKDIIKKRKNELSLQFREALYSIASSLSAGKSIETAFNDAQKELYIQYPDTETYIIIELEQISKRLEMNETIEEALSDFAARSHLEDILNFADVFTICKRTGGNLVQVIKNTAEIISEKIDVKQEINVLLTEKRLEHKILNLMPVFIVLMLSTSAEEFMTPVFSEPMGRAAMTFSLVLFTAAYFISRKIMDIEV